MIFVDKVKVTAIAGRGGDGKLSFRHELYLSKGGPDGGDGGNGGEVIFQASTNQNTLTTFRYKKELKAEDGVAGGKRRQHGRSGEDLIVLVPVGTIVTDISNNAMLADLVEDNQKAIIAKGGKGGFGNAHFQSSTRQAPNFAEKGLTGEILELNLELKMIADVGLVGLPNAGKSTFLARVSNAHPEIADYPFTTLTPNLGVADIDKNESILIADIPGLIEGAAEGKGLGHDFLRHIERTSVILHLIDAYTEDMTSSYLTIRNELNAYNPNLSKRPEIVALTKTEGLDQEIINDLISQLKKVSKKIEVYPISSMSGQNINPLLYKLNELIKKRKSKKIIRRIKEKIPIISLPKTDENWRVSKSKKTFIVSGKSIEIFAEKTDFNNDQALNRLKDIMRRWGIIHELNRRGIKPDDIVQIGKNDGPTFKY